MMNLIPFLTIAVILLINYFVFFRFYSLSGNKSYKNSFFLSLGSSLTCIGFIISGIYFDLVLLRIIAFYYFTFIFLLFFISLLFLAIFSVRQLRSKRRLEWISILTTFVVYLVYGVLNANNLVVNEINLQSRKISDSIKFIQVSDIHIGSESPRFLEEIVDNIKELEKDFVVITGDLVDEDDVQVDDLIALSEIDVPVYFVIGNHDAMTRKGIEFFQSIGLTVLNNDKVAFNDDLDIIGINIYDSTRRFNRIDVGNILDRINIDNSKYALLLNHEPSQLNPVIDKRIDLQLSGHTHDGQIWPFNFFVGLVYDYTYGMYNLSDDTKLYVSSGTGVWGPNIRVGSKNEIVLFSIGPNSG